MLNSRLTSSYVHLIMSSFSSHWTVQSPAPLPASTHSIINMLIRENKSVGSWLIIQETFFALSLFYRTHKLAS